MKNLNRARRISQKLLGLLTILPEVLRDYVPEVRDGIRKFVLGMKLIEGRCINAQEAMELGVPFGSRPLLPEDLEKAKTLIIEGLSMLEGAYVDSRCSIPCVYVNIPCPIPVTFTSQLLI